MCFPKRNIPEQKKIEEHQIRINEVGFELGIPGYKLKFFFNHDTLTDIKYRRENRNENETSRESGTSFKKSS